MGQLSGPNLVSPNPSFLSHPRSSGLPLPLAGNAKLRALERCPSGKPLPSTKGFPRTGAHDRGGTPMAKPKYITDAWVLGLQEKLGGHWGALLFLASLSCGPSRPLCIFIWESTVAGVPCFPGSSGQSSTLRSPSREHIPKGLRNCQEWETGTCSF